MRIPGASGYTLNDDQFLEVTILAVPFEEEYAEFNAHVSRTTADEHWTGTFWVNNVTDTEHRLRNTDLGHIGFIEPLYAPPQ